MSGSQPIEYRFGDFVLAPEEKRLSRGGADIHLRPKTFEVLTLLVENHQRLVDRQSLFDEAWRGVQVTDNALTRCIKEIREALGDDANDPVYVKTIPKQGYKFVAAVQSADSPRSETATIVGNASTPSKLESIAVLPFADMSEGRDQEYFCDGIAEDILTALSRLDALRVVARTSSFAFKDEMVDMREVGRRLGVDALLEGSVRRDGDRLRVTAQLINASDGYHIWSERYDRDARDIFRIQDEISLSIAEKLRFQLQQAEHEVLVRRHTNDVEAYHLFSKGRQFLNRRSEGDFDRALASFQESLRRDPNYILPYIATANIFTILGVWGFVPPAEAFDNVKASAMKALEIDETMAEAHLALALRAFLYERDREESDRRFELAFQLKLHNPLGNAWYSMRLLEKGREDDAVAQARKALRLDPLSASIHAVVAAGHVSAGRLSEAQALLKQSLELDETLALAHHWLGWTYVVQGNDEDAEVELRKAANGGLLISKGALGITLARRGRADAARETLAELERLSSQTYVPLLPRALIHAGLGDFDRSFVLYDEALETREPSVVLATLGKFMTGVLPEPWIAEARRRLG